MMVSMFLVGRLVGKIDARLLVGTGMALSAVSLWMMSLFSPIMNSTPFIVTGVIQGAGLGLLFVPLNTLAFATLAPDLRTDAASFFMLLRNLGGSIGVSLGVGVLARQTQISHADIGGALTPYSIPWADGSVAQALGVTGETVMTMLDHAVNAQAAMIAYLDVYRLMFWVTVAVMPLILLLRPPKQGAKAPDMVE